MVNCADNVAITQFQVRRQALDPIGYECLIEVTSFAAAAHHCRLYIELNGELQDVIPLELVTAAASPASAVLRFRRRAAY